MFLMVSLLLLSELLISDFYEVSFVNSDYEKLWNIFVLYDELENIKSYDLGYVYSRNEKL